MTAPVLGVAIKHADLETLRDWIFDADRAIEFQDFVFPDVIAADPADRIAAYRRDLAGHRGRRGIHGPFFGLDLSNPDAEMRGVIRSRLLKGLEIAAGLGADQMVIHSPFTFWHRLNYVNYPFLRKTLFEAAADCLAPVLARAADQGCTLVLENIDDTDPMDRGDLVAMIDHPNLMLSIDTGHADLAHGNYGAPPVVDFIDLARGRLAHVHLQDVDGHADRHWHPGDGRIAWGPVFDALAIHDPAPRLILEVRANLDRLPQTVAALADRGLAR